jgi:hypothetical protein
LNVTFKHIPSFENTNNVHVALELGETYFNIAFYQKEPLKLLGLLLCVIDENENFEDSFNKTLASYFKEENSFKNVSVIFNNKNSTLLPNQFFKQSAMANVLNHLFAINETEHYFFYKETQSLSATNIYAIHKKKFDGIKSIMPNFTHLHSFYFANTFNNVTKLHCQIMPNYLKVNLTENNKLIATYYAAYHSALDACYQLLNACERFNINKGKLKLELCGMVELNSALYQEIHKYFLDISFTEIPDQFSIAAPIKNLPTQYYAHLLNQIVCEL